MQAALLPERDVAVSPELTRVVAIAAFYGDKIASAGARTASSAMKVIAREVDKDGVHREVDTQGVEEPE